MCEYLDEAGLRVQYLHSDVKTLERIEILQNLRQNQFDILVGINLLREGLDIPECGLVAILDSDKEGYLRSRSALIQTMGRAARNVEGRVILYGDKITKSMETALEEVKRRRKIQQDYNEKHGITPQNAGKKDPRFHVLTLLQSDKGQEVKDDKVPNQAMLESWEKEMHQAAEEWDFEKAQKLKERIEQHQAFEGRKQRKT